MLKLLNNEKGMVPVLGLVMIAIIILGGLEILTTHKEKMAGLHVTAKVTNKPVSEIVGEPTVTDKFVIKHQGEYANTYKVCLDGYEYYVTDQWAGSGITMRLTWDEYHNTLKPVTCNEEEWKRQ